jgi:hypothetical protein
MLTRTASRPLGLLVAGVLLAVALPSRSARADGGLGYFKNYFVTGDYVTGAVGLQR